MNRFFKDKYDCERLAHFAFVGLIAGLIVSDVDLDKLTQKMTMAIAIGSTVRTAVLPPPPKGDSDDAE